MVREMHQKDLRAMSGEVVCTATAPRGSRRRLRSAKKRVV